MVGVWDGILLFVFDFDGTLTSRNVTSRGVPPLLIDSVLTQAGMAESGPAFYECLKRMKAKGKYVAIASYGDSHITSKGKIGGRETIEYSLSHFVAKGVEEKDREEFLRSHLFDLEAFMPSQQWYCFLISVFSACLLISFCKAPGLAGAKPSGAWSERSGKRRHV